MEAKRRIRELTHCIHDLETKLGEIETVANAIVGSLESGGTIWTCGNGGSAAQGIHLSAELVGRFETARQGLRCLSLEANTSIITALSNDFSYSEVFARQINSVVKSNDSVIFFSCSGKSENILKGIEACNQRGATSIGLTGGGEMAKQMPTKHLLSVSSERTSTVQEVHLLIVHIICGIIDERMS